MPLGRLDLACDDQSHRRLAVRNAHGHRHPLKCVRHSGGTAVKRVSALPGSARRDQRINGSFSPSRIRDLEGPMDARRTLTGLMILYALTLLFLSQVLPVRLTPLPPVHAAAVD